MPNEPIILAVNHHVIKKNSAKIYFTHSFVRSLLHMVLVHLSFANLPCFFTSFLCRALPLDPDTHKFAIVHLIIVLYFETQKLSDVRFLQSNLVFVYLQLNGMVLLSLAQGVNLCVHALHLPGPALCLCWSHGMYEHDSTSE